VDSPTEALIGLIVWCALSLQTSAWQGLLTLTLLRIGFPQRWPAFRGQPWWLAIDSDVIQYLPDLSAVVMKAMMRICPPQMGHSSGNTS
jgi:hypothetical protein